MREGWEIIQFGDLCELTRGHNPPKSKFINEEKEGYVRFYQIRDGWSDEYKVYVPDTPQLHTVLPDDMLMVAYRHIGKVFRGVTGAFNVALCKISNRNNEILNDDFLFYMIPSEIIRGELMKRSERSLIPSMSVVHLKSLQIPVPPLEEQKQIVAILDKAFTAINQAKANIEKNIENAKELFQSKLNDIFNQQGEGWEEKKLKEISIDFGRGKSKNRPRNDKKLFGGKYPFVQTGDIRNTGKILKTFSQTYNEIGLAQSKLWPKGTICITIAANIAETAILDFDSCFPDSMIGLVVDTQKADSNYTYYALQYLKSRLQELGKGSAQDNINLGTFQKQYFPFPSIEKQKEIVVILDGISKQTIKIESKYQQKLLELEELKKSLLQKAFSGELTGPEGTKDVSKGYDPSPTGTPIIATKQNPERVV